MPDTSTFTGAWTEGILWEITVWTRWWKGGKKLNCQWTWCSIIYLWFVIASGWADHFHICLPDPMPTDWPCSLTVTPMFTGMKTKLRCHSVLFKIQYYWTTSISNHKTWIKPRNSVSTTLPSAPASPLPMLTMWTLLLMAPTYIQHHWLYRCIRCMRHL